MSDTPKVYQRSTQAPRACGRTRNDAALLVSSDKTGCSGLGHHLEAVMDFPELALLHRSVHLRGGETAITKSCMPRQNKGGARAACSSTGAQNPSCRGKLHLHSRPGKNSDRSTTHAPSV